MSLAERIKAAQAKLAETREQLTEKSTAFAASETPSDADAEIIKTLSDDVEKQTQSLETLLAAEQALAKQASRGPTIITSGHTVKKPEDLIVRHATAVMEAYIGRVPVEQVLERRYGSHPEFEQIKATLPLVTKAAQNPAMTNVAGWAQELVQESVGAFMDLLAPESVVPRLPLQRFVFDGYGAIKVPKRASRTPNLAAAFRAEGAPIRVGAASIGSDTLTPKSMGVIGTFTNELFERSTPNIEAAIRAWMLEDTAIALDTAFLSATAGTATQPAGIQAGIAATDTAVSTGVTAANMIADLRGRLQALSNHGYGRRPVWVMNPARAWGIGLALTAAGTPAFPEMAGGQGTLLRIPVVTSTTVPANVIYLIDAAELAFAGGAPRFMGTDVATIHEEDAAPLPIADDGATAGGSATGVGNGPVRSLFQTNSSALRALWELDWKVMRAGAVQTITAANY